MNIPDHPGVLGYLAGLLDGEGTVTVKKSRGPGAVNDCWIPEVHISNTNVAALRWIADTLQVGKVYASKPGDDKWQIVYFWRTGGSNAISLLEALYPYLRIKRLHADALFTLRGLRRDGTRLSPELVARRLTLVQYIKTLNRRGRAA